MIDKKKLDAITDFLIWQVFRNDNVMYNGRLDTDELWLKLPKSYNDEFHGEIEEVELVDIIASLHNLLYEAVTGRRYDYMFHWTNKIGADCLDNIFDEGV